MKMSMAWTKPCQYYGHWRNGLLHLITDSFRLIMHKSTLSRGEFLKQFNLITQMESYWKWRQSQSIGNLFIMSTEWSFCRCLAHCWISQTFHTSLNLSTVVALCFPLDASDLEKGVVDTNARGTWCPNWQQQQIEMNVYGFLISSMRTEYCTQRKHLSFSLLWFPVSLAIPGQMNLCVHLQMDEFHR